jgi:CubicO group peptidase (beta-lactamase class C family)
VGIATIMKEKTKILERLLILVIWMTVMAVSAAPSYAQLDFDGGSPDSVGIDPGPITDLADAITDGTFQEVHGLLLIRHGKVVHESYYEGNTDYFDDNLNRVSPGDTLWDASMPHYVASVAKSVTSAMVGIALTEHNVDVDSTVRELIPAYRIRFFARETAITVRHLLTMTGGHDWDEWGTDDLTKMWRSGDDFIEFALRPEMAHDAGTFWRYNSGEVNILMGIVDALSGGAATYIQQRLFDPLEITDFEWRTQPGGLPEAAARLFMRPRDLAKFAQLYLNRGVWNGQQIVPEAWVDSSLSVQFSTKPLTEWDYGYLWWAKTIDFKQNGVERTERYFAAEGDGGNLVALFPDLDLAVVITQGNYSNFGVYDSQIRSMLADYILPATSSVATGTNEDPTEIAGQTHLTVNIYPNPSAGVLSVRYSVREAGRVKVEVFDFIGRRVHVLADGHQDRGSHQVRYADPSLPAGTYFVRIMQTAGVATGKVVIVP